jgi:LAS superfamily LD-carboxypeptidase LdcB
MRNGLLEETGMLVSDPVSGAKLVPPAMEDFKRLAAAYAKKFSGKVLKGSGYRTYASQVSVRMLRSTGAGNPCGSGEVNAAGVTIGMAATPGRSNHGWGAAVDLNRSDWEHGATKNRKKAGTSKHFRWINKFSKDFNFVFGVSGEHWHIDWMPFTKQVTGWSGMVATAQTPWTSEGVGDTSISLV